jgi:hypothetical protein
MLGGRQGQVNEGHACGSLAVDGNSGHCLNMRLRYLPNPPGSRHKESAPPCSMHKKQTQSGRFLGTSMFATLLVISMFFQAKGCLKIPPSAISHHFTAQHSSIWSKISSAHRIASKNGTDGWRNPRRCQISSYKAEPFIRGLISPLGKRDEALDSKRRPARDYYQPLEKLFSAMTGLFIRRRIVAAEQ